ncbi:MAG: hypothetical protein N838_32875 [Thiohalocapsa sp. PB-PSB1]|nr:MAG: hypothetical protein N838_32875 [Thiohalocapsa sp. PB-PSB1]
MYRRRANIQLRRQLDKVLFLPVLGTKKAAILYDEPHLPSIHLATEQAKSVGVRL